MIEVAGHFDGHHVVLDGPVPDGVVPNARVRIVFENSSASEALGRIAALAVPGGLPADFAEQHEHCVKGIPQHHRVSEDGYDQLLIQDRQQEPRESLVQVRDRLNIRTTERPFKND